MGRFTLKQIVLLALTASTVIGGYAYLRYAYKVTDDLPFTQEIVLIILGTVATVLITAMLLNQQTAVEIEKEQNVRFIDLKTRAYEQLLDLIEAMILSDEIERRDIVRLQFITHRLAIFASAPVLHEYHHFLEAIGEGARDGRLREDSEELNRALSRLTVQIRADLIGEQDVLGNYAPGRIRQLIDRNFEESVEIEAEHGREG